MLNALESLCSEQGVKYRKEQEGIVVRASAIYPKCWHPVLLVESGEEIIALTRFPQPDRCEITDVDKLCFILGQMLSAGTLVSFDPDHRRFSVLSTVERDSLDESLTSFAADCDVLLPLLNRVGETGRWNNELIGLAFVPASEMEYHA